MYVEWGGLARGEGVDGVGWGVVWWAKCKLSLDMWRLLAPPTWRRDGARWHCCWCRWWITMHCCGDRTSVLSIILVWKRDIDVKVGCGVVLYVNEG